MLSEFIPSQHSYSAVHLAVEQIHQRSVHFGPLVARTDSEIAFVARLQNF